MKKETSTLIIGPPGIAAPAGRPIVPGCLPPAVKITSIGMGKKTIVVFLVGLTLASVRFADAQQPKKIPRAAFRVQLQFLDVQTPNDIETAFRAASKGRADAVLVLVGPVFILQRPQITELAVKSRLPVIGVIIVAQQPAKIPRIGILAGASESSTPPFEPFQLGSRDSS
jgi:hypothetical protein